MPKLFEWKGWEFLFYSLDGQEPPHVHARKDRKEAKFWLADVRLARNKRCTDRELNELIAVVHERRAMFLESWHGYFGD